jgi:amidase
MKFKRPTPADLQTAAKDLGLKLNKAQSTDFRDAMLPLLHGFDALDREQDVVPVVKYPKRTFAFPKKKDNPHNAWYVRTSLKGAPSGPLKGRTVAIKDVIFVAGVPMMNGAAVLKGFVPDFDATVVTRVLDAGGEITGKATCEYLCVSGGSVTASTGIVDNPRKPGYSTGGSSSGCAALVAGGYVDMAIGSDQAGSVRQPSGWSGICGFKPTFGLVPYTGAMGQEFCIDHLGPMTATVADNALLLEVLAGHDGYDGRQQELKVHKYTGALGRDVRGMKIGVLREGFDAPQAQKDAMDCVRTAAARLKRLGATVEEVSIPMHYTGVAVWAGVLSDGMWQTFKQTGLGGNARAIYSPAQFKFMEYWLKGLPEFTPNAQLLVLMGKYLERYHGRYYYKAKNLTFKLRAAYDAALAKYDLLLMPTAYYKAYKVPKTIKGMGPKEVFQYALVGVESCCQFDVTGHPAMSVPCGLRDGLPVGMMLVGKHFDEPTIYRAAHAFEQSGNWMEM